MPRRRRSGAVNKGGDAPGVPQPYVDLAREIHDEVLRIAADPAAHADLLTEVIDRVPLDKRMGLARTIFDELSAEQQWDIIERVYGDEEIRTYLATERHARLEQARRETERRRVAGQARARKELDTSEVERGEHLTLGLFRDADASAAVVRGHTSSTCARRLVLRALGDGTFQVIEDVFNPRGGYFVTGEYSEDTWRAHDRLAGHTVVRVGSITESNGRTRFEPLLYPGARVDFEVGGSAVEGRLHLGFAMLSDVDVFVP